MTERESGQTPCPVCGIVHNAELPTDFRLSDYIASLKWSDSATEHEKTLVIGNLRHMFSITAPSHNKTVTALLAATARLAELESQLAAARRDAERYQWLRQRSSHQELWGKKHAGQIQVIQWAGATEANVLTPAALDAAIDRALQAEPPLKLEKDAIVRTRT